MKSEKDLYPTPEEISDDAQSDDTAENGEYRSDFTSDIGWRENDDNGMEAPEIEKTEQSEEAPDLSNTRQWSAVTENEDSLGDSGENNASGADGKEHHGEKKKKKLKKRRHLLKREDSLIMHVVDRTVDGLYEKGQKGIIGHFFTAYEKLENRVKKSAIISFPLKISAFFEKRRLAKIKEETVYDDVTGEAVAVIRDRASIKRSLLARMLSLLDGSVLIGKIKNFLTALLYLPMSTYGALLLSVGITTVLVQAAKVFWFSETYSLIGIVIGIAYTLVAMITIFAGDFPLVRYLCESKIGSFLLVSVFGVSKETVDLEKSVPKRRFWAFVVGFTLGILSALISAWNIFLAVIVLIVALGVAHNPESGMVISIAALPFAGLVENGESYLCAAIIYVALAWILKLIRGQRRMSFGALEGWMLLFATFVAVSTLVSADRAEAWEHMIKIIAAILGFFIVSGMFSSRKWLNRAIGALMLSGFAVSCLGIYEWVIKAERDMWKLDKILENDISSVFISPESLYVFLAVVFFMALSGIRAYEEKRGRLFSLLTLFTVIICTLLTFDTYMYLTLTLTVMLVCVIRSRKNLIPVLVTSLVIVAVISTVTEIIPGYITDILAKDLAENTENLNVAWKMAARYCLTGIGLGKGVFESALSSFVGHMPPKISDAGSLFGEITVRLGIVGLVFMVVALVLVYRQAFSTLKTFTVRKYASKYSLGAISALTAILVLSGVSYVWAEFPCALLFWTVAGLVCASRRTVLFENNDMHDLDVMSIDIPISSFRKGAKTPAEPSCEKGD